MSMRSLRGRVQTVTPKSATPKRSTPKASTPKTSTAVGGTAKSPVGAQIPATPRLEKTQTIDTLLGGLRIGETKILNEEQIRQLKSVTYDNGTPIVSLENRSLLYEIIGMITKIGYDTVYQYLTSRAWTNGQDIVFLAPTLLQTRDKVLSDADAFKRKIKPGKGVAKCGKCGSEEVYTAEKQTRSADEPMTIFFTCAHCSARWRQ